MVSKNKELKRQVLSPKSNFILSLVAMAKKEVDALYAPKEIPNHLQRKFNGFALMIQRGDEARMETMRIKAAAFDKIAELIG